MKEFLSELEGYLEKPTARGLSHAVSRAIRNGVLTPGMKLPPIRTVATQLGLAPATVSHSWALLARSGVIRTDGRRGTTVVDTNIGASSRYRRALEHSTTFGLDLSTGVPDSALLPDLTRALQYLTKAATPGSYLDEPVLPELVDVLRADWPYEAEEITVVDGAMDALELAARSFVRFGERVIVEHPCFPPLLDLPEAIFLTASIPSGPSACWAGRFAVHPPSQQTYRYRRSNHRLCQLPRSDHRVGLQLAVGPCNRVGRQPEICCQPSHRRKPCTGVQLTLRDGRRDLGPHLFVRCRRRLGVDGQAKYAHGLHGMS